MNTKERDRERMRGIYADARRYQFLKRKAYVASCLESRWGLPWKRVWWWTMTLVLETKAEGGPGFDAVIDREIKQCQREGIDK